MANPPANPSSGKAAAIQAPSGTRDFYPLELARRRWIEDKWRKVAIRHGFEEIDGPTFEETELYTRKSGDGIVGEIFGVYSGKDEVAVKKMGERLAAGERGAIAPFALRPEFTPTLARMYAARAKQLPQPCKWFWQGPCYRAERPQRGRLREFWQWNCDILGGQSPEEIRRADAEVVACVAQLLEAVGLTPEVARIKVGHRKAHEHLARAYGLAYERVQAWIQLLDQRAKLPRDVFLAKANSIGLSSENVQDIETKLGLSDTKHLDLAKVNPVRLAQTLNPLQQELNVGTSDGIMRELGAELTELQLEMNRSDLGDWYSLDLSIARGLAYYTGMVFEVIVDGERAVAGGGRYDNLIETFGGPPAPAVGFGMGDVVLSLVLQDKGLMPTDKQIAADLGLRPDVFVISNEENTALVAPMVAQLRREGKHARRSYKATKNVGKLLQDANAAGARFAVIIESPTEITLKDMDANTQDRGPAAELLKRITPPK